MTDSNLLNSINQLKFSSDSSLQPDQTPNTSGNNMDSNNTNFFNNDYLQLQYQQQSDYTPKRIWNQTSYSNQNQNNWQQQKFQPLSSKDSYDNSFFNDLDSTNSTSNKYMTNNLLNAPSYIPNQYTTNKFPQTPSSTNSRFNDDSSKEEISKLKNELILKNQIIKNLTEQINIMIKNKNNKSYYDMKDENSITTYKVPSNHYQLFQDLSRTLQEKCDEVEELNQRMEIVLVSSNLVHNPNSFAIDIEELGHKLLTKMNHLQKENDELLKMVSLSNKQSLIVENELLKKGNYE
ncbi:MUM2 [Candida pseudojiufengensis]|uniref:MUM2 n=1 Tax=Candida pseudojiufengensis TaxID=497109 RepID=UPI0022252B46|nr:MUM2 [Candida pseudojiufengensis]KAI5958679.1 MUM2 [Candida pseudojiufengensis]